jgi:hypothetical protein
VGVEQQQQCQQHLTQPGPYMEPAGHHAEPGGEVSTAAVVVRKQPHRYMVTVGLGVVAAACGP